MREELVALITGFCLFLWALSLLAVGIQQYYRGYSEAICTNKIAACNWYPYNKDLK